MSISLGTSIKNHEGDLLSSEHPRHNASRPQKGSQNGLQGAVRDAHLALQIPESKMRVGPELTQGNGKRRAVVRTPPGPYPGIYIYIYTRIFGRATRALDSLMRGYSICKCTIEPTSVPINPHTLPHARGFVNLYSASNTHSSYSTLHRGSSQQVNIKCYSAHESSKPGKWCSHRQGTRHCADTCR